MELVAAVVGVAEVTTRCGSKVWTLCNQWKDAPRDIVQLRDDLDRSGRFFGALRQGIPEELLLATQGATADDDDDESKSRLVALADLRILLRQGHGVVEDLQHFVDELVVSSSSGDGGGQQESAEPAEPTRSSIRTSRKILWLRRVHDIKRLKASLKHVTTQIGFQLALLNLTISADVRYDIVESESRLTTELHRGIQSAAENVTNIVRASSWEIQEHVSMATSSAAMRVVRDVALLDLNRHSEHAQHLAHLHDSIQSQGHQLDEIKTILMGLGPLSYAPDLQSNAKQHRISRNFQKQIIQRDEDLRWSSTSAACSRMCNCRCHSLKCYGHWEFRGFQQVFGAIRVSFSGSLIRGGGGNQCTSKNCHANRTKRGGRLNVNYTLPSWMSTAVVELCLARLPEPELVIRVHRIVPLNDYLLSSSSIFIKVISRDLEGTRLMVRERPSAVHDVRGQLGSTVLLYALPGVASAGSMDIARFLVQAGADPFRENEQGVSAVSTAFDQFLLMEDAKSREQLADLLPFERYLDDKEFTDLHRLVAGFQPLDLATALENPHFRNDIRSKSLDGTTPLHLAASRGDALAVQLLLAAGADVNAQSANNVTPLGAACHRCNEATIAALLAHGASPQMRDVFGAFPLHYMATSRGYSSRALELLVNYGADINVTDSKGKSTPLGLAARRDGVDAIRDLVARGADIDHRDWEGDVPLNDALATKSHNAVAALLECGADCTTVNDHGQTVLHWLAAAGDEQMVAIFEAAGLVGVDVDMADKNGRTAMDVFVDQRVGASAELRLAFQKLLGNIRADTIRASKRNSQFWEEEGPDDDEFFDAREETG